VIVEVGQEAVANPADVQQKIRRAREQGRRSVLLLVDRQGDLRFVALNIPG
jgi:serine protease Do